MGLVFGAGLASGSLAIAGATLCVTMFFISSIALYSVVSKNLLAVYPEWSSALTWAFPVFQTIMQPFIPPT